MGWTRREQLKLIGAGVLAAAFGGIDRLSAADESGLPSLSKVAVARGLRYGAAFQTDLTTANPAYASLFARQCELAAAALSWSLVSTAAGKYQLTRAQRLVDFIRANRMRLTGAHLLWHEATPNWFRALGDRPTAERAMLEHVRWMTTRYAGQVYAWNVVNEAIEPNDGRSDGLRVKPFLDLLGKSYIDRAFRAARQADPRALLVYNQDRLEEDRPYAEARRRALLLLLDDLARSGTPIDAVGIQAHLTLADFRFDERRYRSFLANIAGRGLKIIISELDVLDVGAPSDFVARDRAVADLYSRFLGVALDERAVAAVVTWGLSDRHTWLTPRSDASFARSDGLPTRPLPFDRDLRPKPAFYALLNALKSAPARHS